MAFLCLLHGSILPCIFISLQYWSVLNWHYLRLRCGSCKLIFLTLFHHVFAKFRNAVQSFEPGETPSFLVSHQESNCMQRSFTLISVPVRYRLPFLICLNYSVLQDLTHFHKHMTNTDRVQSCALLNWIISGSGAVALRFR